MDRTRKALLAAVAVIGLALSATACGIPEDGPVVPLGLPKFDPASGYTGGIDPVPSTLSARESVAQFLKAAAGDPAKRQNRLERFMTEGRKEQRWGELDGLPLVELDGQPQPIKSGVVQVKGTIVAFYTSDGQVVPPETGNTSVDMTYNLAQDLNTGEWLFTEAPAQILLDAAHFVSSYESAPVYFLSKPDHRNVVPDTRYLFKEASPESRAAALLSWLVTGPSPAMKSFVYTAIPPGTKLNSAAQRADGTVVVDLDSGAANLDTTLVSPQVAWTLRSAGPDRVSGFDVQVDSISKVTRQLSEFRSHNLASRTDPHEVSPHVIADGAIQPPLPPAPEGSENQGLRFVVPHPSAAKTIVVASTGVRVYMPVSEVPKSTLPSAIDITGLPAGEVGRPTWLGDDTVLIPVAGKVYAAVLGSEKKAPAGDKPIMTGTVGRIAAAPDGVRLAYTSGGRAYWVAVQGNGDGTFTVGSTHDVAPDMSQVRDIGWSREDRVVITGVNPDKQHLLEYSLDNMFVQAVEDTGSASELDELAVRCFDPWIGSDLAKDLYVTLGDTVYQSLSGVQPRLSQYHPVPGDSTSVLKGRGLFLQ